MRRLEFFPHPDFLRLLHADMGHGCEVFIGMLGDPAMDAFATLAPTARDLAEAACHTDGPRFLARRALTRSLLARRIGVAADEVMVGHDAYGAPKVWLRQDCEPPDLQVFGPGLAKFTTAQANGEVRASVGVSLPSLSIAARQNLFALAFSPHAVGIDIEPVGEPQEPPWNILSSPDQASLRRLEPKARHLAFLHIWTRREARLKRLGRGFYGESAEGAPVNAASMDVQLDGQNLVVAVTA